MRFLLLCFPFIAFALDFVIERDCVYKLDSSAFSVQNGELTINEINAKNITQNKSLKTESSKLIMSENLAFYYHLSANLSQNMSENLANLANLDFNQNCFFISKSISHKSLKTKSSAVLLNLNELDSSNNQKFYFGCLKSGKYIN